MGNLYHERALRGIPWSTYIQSPVFKAISSRLYQRHRIKIADHIHVMEKLGDRLGQGFAFEPKDSEAFRRLLRAPAFAHDNTDHLCDRVAAGATKGKGYREVGVPSLHIAVAAGTCRVHIDNFGFVAIGPDGRKYYNPDFVQHIVDELLWEDIVVNRIWKTHPRLANAMSHIRPLVPNSRRGYRPEFGVRLDIRRGTGWQLGIEATQSLTGERRVMGMLDVLNF